MVRDLLDDLANPLGKNTANLEAGPSYDLFGRVLNKAGLLDLLSGYLAETISNKHLETHNLKYSATRSEGPGIKG